MKNVISLLLLICLLTVWTSCKKTLKDEVEVKPPVTGSAGYGTKGIKINFPSGFSGNKADYTILSLMVNAALDSDGNVKAAINKGRVNVAWIFDKNEKPFMAGFLTDTTTIIDAASTAKVLLYYTYGLDFKPTIVINKFVNQIETVKGVKEWIATYTQLFQTDPAVLATQGYTAKLKEAANNISKQEILDIKVNKVGDIRVDEGDVKSGLQVASVNEVLGKFSVTNKYRRRAHAYFYKTEFKDLSGIRKGVISEINATTASDRNEIVDPTGGATSISTVLGTWLEGKDYEFAEVKSGPWDLPLADNESEATYKLRVVGPGGVATSTVLTNAEELKLKRLIAETLTLDFVVPVLMQIKSLKGMDDNSGHLVQYTQTVNVVDNLLGAMPGVYEELRKSGDFKAATVKFIDNLKSPAASESFKLLMETIYKSLAVNLSEEYLPSLQEINARAGKVNIILEIINHLMQIGDYGRVLGDMTFSKPIEEWTLKVRSSMVTLTTAKEVVISYEGSKISAVIKNLKLAPGTHPFFEWKTSGKYGKLSDTKGHSQQVSFNSADSIVTYESRESVSEQTTNIDYVYVTAFYDNKEIGKDTIAIAVKKDKYNITPDGLTLSGQEGETHSAALYLTKPNGSSEIDNSPDFDYKVIWTTAGKYGRLTGSKTTITNYNTGRMTYTVFDDKTKEATEAITASVYAKRKSEPESAYKLTSTDDVIIKINNDDKKKIVHYSLASMHFDELVEGIDSHFITYWYHNCANIGLAPIKEEKDAVSYSLKFTGGIIIGANASYTWTPKNLSFPGAPDMPGSPKQYSNGTFYVYYTSIGSKSSPTYVKTFCCHETPQPKFINGVRAEVVITLK